MPRKVKTQTLDKGETIKGGKDDESNSTDSFEISDMNPAWEAWSKSDYDNFQPIAELVDNAIAAVKSSGKVYINFDFETGNANIEHSGGITFPSSPTELSRCFTYGSKKQTNLNEHGCGLKSSLAILNPQNNTWAVYFKTGKKNPDGSLEVLSIKAPYSQKMNINREPNWPGKNNDAEPGSFICFPIYKDRFKDLYSSKNAKISDIKELHIRISCHLSHLWMKEESYLSGKIEMFYNNDRVFPFRFNMSDDHVSKFVKKTFTLSTGGIVNIEEITLDKDTSKVPGSFMFKFGMASNGVYLFKNGRLVMRINGDQHYIRIFGSTPHNSHNGIIKIVNMIGNQDQLPPTVPTKNRFVTSTLFDEFIETLSNKITPLDSTEQKSEENDVTSYTEKRQRIFASVNQSYRAVREHSFGLTHGKTPPIDLTEYMKDEIHILEFKKDTHLTPKHIQQMMYNWILTRNSPEVEGKNLIAVIMLRALKDSKNVITDSNKEQLRILKESFGFCPMIRNTDDETLYGGDSK